MDEELPEGIGHVDFGEDKVALGVPITQHARRRDEGGKDLADVAGGHLRGVGEGIDGGVRGAIGHAAVLGEIVDHAGLVAPVDDAQGGHPEASEVGVGRATEDRDPPVHYIGKEATPNGARVLPGGRAVAGSKAGGVVGGGVPNRGADPVRGFLHKGIDVRDAGEVVLDAGGVEVGAKEFALETRDQGRQGIVEVQQRGGGGVGVSGEERKGILGRSAFVV